MAEDIDMEEDNPLSPNSITMILCNLFCKESSGDPIDFYLRRNRYFGSPSKNIAFNDKFEKLKIQIEECGGRLKEEPCSCYCIELVFPEMIDNLDEIDSDLFKADFIQECINNRELLDLEEFRLGESTHDSSVNINSIMNGFETWDTVKRTSPQKGRKLPDFGLPILNTSPLSVKHQTLSKRGRVEYSTEEDLAILKFLLEKNLYHKLSGNSVWKTVHLKFPNHSYQSLQNRFRRIILPNLNKYKGLTESERKLFRHGPFENDPLTSSNETKDTTFVTSKYFNNAQTVDDNSVEQRDISSSSQTVDDNSVEQRDISKPIENEGAKVDHRDGKNERKAKPLQYDGSSDEIDNNHLKLVVFDKTSNDPIPDLTINSQSRVIIEESQLSSSELEDSESASKQDGLPSTSTDRLDEISTDKKSKSRKISIGTFNIKDDKCILKYIIDNKRFSEVSDSHKLWKDIQDSAFEDSEKTWKSIKRRFQRVIIQHLESQEYDLDPKIIRKFRKTSKHPKSVASSEGEISVCTTNEGSSDSDRNEYRTENAIKRKGQRLYTLEEDKLIIDYIVKNKRFDEVRGKVLWVNIQDNVLHSFDRSWESAKNRFLKTILKNLKKYRLSPDIIKNFQSGLVAERNLGGARREPIRGIPKKRTYQVESESEDETLVKHPALVSKKSSTPCKLLKRQLYRQPAIPLPIVFSPQPGPSVAKNNVGFSHAGVKRVFAKPIEKTKTSTDTVGHTSCLRGQPQDAHTKHETSRLKNRTISSKATRWPTKKVISPAKDRVSPTKNVTSPAKDVVSHTKNMTSPAKDTGSPIMKLVPAVDVASCDIDVASSAESTISSMKITKSHVNAASVLKSAESPVEAHAPPVHQEMTNSSPSRQLHPSPCKPCSVVIKRLTETQLKMYGCTSTGSICQSTTTIAPLPRDTYSPLSKVSRFTVEISSTLLAARLSAARSMAGLDSPTTSTISSTSFRQWMPLASSFSRPALRSIKLNAAQSSENESSFRTDSLGFTSQLKRTNNSLILSTSESPNSFTSTFEVDIEKDANRMKLPMSARLNLRSLNASKKDSVFVKDDQSSDGDYHTPEG